MCDARLDELREQMRRAMAVQPAKPEAERKMHKVPCKHCPSAHHPPDPESQDIMTWPHADRVNTAFPCGWNGKRFCKGYCDKMGITNADLQSAVF